MQAALNLEKTVNEALYQLHEVAVSNKDDEVRPFMLCALSISFECLSELLLLLEQISIIVVNSIKKSYISNVRIL